MQEGKKAKNNICEPSPRVELGSSELRGPLGGRGRGGALRFWEPKGTAPCPLRGPWAALNALPCPGPSLPAT
jgi:hypothetical protein